MNWDVSDAVGAGTMIAMIVLLIAVIGWIARVLRQSAGWSLAVALSEGGQASSSRMIAFFGFIVIVDVLLGFGLFSVWSLFHTKALPSMTGALSLLGGSATLFTPYFANQVKAGFASAITAPSSVQITLASPSSIPVSVPTNVSVLGAGFQAGAAAALDDGQGGSAGTVDGFQLLSPSQAIMRITPYAALVGKSAMLTVRNPSGQTGTVVIGIRGGPNGMTATPEDKGRRRTSR
jgi:hypothetical protein